MPSTSRLVTYGLPPTLGMTPSRVLTPLPTKYSAMDTALGEYHSGAAPATGSWSMRTPAILASSATRLRIRVLSMQEPMCSTGGMPRDSQTSLRPLPAILAAEGCRRPALPDAMDAQPVSTTRISLLIRPLARDTCP